MSRAKFNIVQRFPETMRPSRAIALLASILVPLLVLFGAVPLAHAQLQKVKVGMTGSLASVATVVSVEKGYFKDAGIDVEIDDLGSSADAIALLGQNVLQIVEGGIGAGFFNALDQNLPVIIVADRISSPLGGTIVVRNDLRDKVKLIKDLKGMTTMTNGPGSILLYENIKVLETAGLTLKDVEVKTMGFAQVAIAFANKAVDFAQIPLPWAVQLPEQGIAYAFVNPDETIKPYPIQLGANMANTDWLATNKDLALRYFTAYQRGVRDYCQAYHHGPNRDEVIQIAIKAGMERRPEFLNKFPWPARDVYGHVNKESILDSQAWFVRNGFSKAAVPIDRIVTTEYVDYANKQLGDFNLINAASDLQGCRP